MTASKIETWIKAGYKILGAEGVDGIKIERLAKILKLNKSGFYYYFGTLESYLKSLLQYHTGHAQNIAVEIGICKNIDPDLLHLIVKHKGFFLVEAQLLAKGKQPNAMYDVDEAGQLINKALLQLWKNTGELPGDPAVLLDYLNILRHFIYSRIATETINYEYLHTLAAETRAVLEKVTTDRHFFHTT